MTDELRNRRGRKPSTATLEHLAWLSLRAMFEDELRVLTGERGQWRQRPWSRPLKSFLLAAAASTTLHGEKPDGVTVRWSEEARATFHDRMVQDIIDGISRKLAAGDNPANLPNALRARHAAARVRRRLGIKSAPPKHRTK